MVKCVILILFATSTVHSQSIIGSPCRVESTGYPGNCTVLPNCPKLRDELVTKQRVPQICGFQGTQMVVCCPTQKNPGDVSRQKCKEYSKYAVDENGEKICKHKIVKRIVGGELAGRTEFPHMAGLIFYPDLSRFLCSGFIISELFVLTLSKCASTLRLGTVRHVLLGVTNLHDNDHRQFIKVVKKFDHPQYIKNTGDNDIALLKLEKPIEFNTYVRPICLYPEMKIHAEKAVAAGWGADRFRGKRSDDLKKVTLSILDSKVCAENYTNLKVKPDIHLCTFEPGKDICTIDFGGPLQIEHTGDDIECMYDVIGIGSYGNGCAYHPSVYTRIYPYLDWIEKIVWPETNSS